MNYKAKGIAEQVLIAANVFILFILIFEEKLEVPLWLQPLGRMHPLLLHFPIALLLLALAMEFFRFRTTYASNAFYRTFLTNLLLVSTLLAAVTIIMGLFLAREEGYAGQVLAWHKWTGVGTLWMASLLYWGRQTTWYQVPWARAGTVLTALLLLVAGHYGATLTHGDSFITGPLLAEAEKVPPALEEARVYEHVIQPLFEQKCLSCHNPEKIKGGLLLTDEAAIRKGGKTGKLFVPGNPEMSLLLQRVHLPLDDKKHMPPRGKAQLSAEEVALLAWWVRRNADFKQKVLELPPTDSLRILAEAALGGTSEEQFDFAAADEDLIQKLNDDYRTVAPLARESPALAVNLYNQSTYTPEKLRELNDIRKQIVFLNLTKMPVKDADLKSVGQFENLQKLDLNFTEVSGKGLRELSSLKKLKSLSLAGTPVKYPELAESLRGLGNLRTVAVWNTGLTETEVEQLRKKYPSVRFIEGFKGEKTAPMQLNPPQLKNASPIFGESLALQLHHPIRGVEIRYTTDGTAPDSLRSAVFTSGTVLGQSTSIRAKAYKAGWYGSEEARFEVYRSTYKPDSLRLLLPLNRVHQAEGTQTFFNSTLGTFNANSPAWANHWAGVRDNDLALLAEYKRPVTVSSVTLRTMIEPETGIFPPAAIEVWGGTSETQLKLLGTFKPQVPVKGTPPALQALGGTFKPQTVTFLKIIAKPLPEIPDWHGSKGRRALLLVDEVFVN
ncbi:hypothetical protein GCM10027275_53720 [Rhabdobacter roseus]|uniref:Putative membrane protein n=1 Tax=Rhabdobacter roseus TaxID=1655419 RepID=A0A840U501_9BACT|nr:c-type cytochrome domain-containing protein [Rhabdobacter roseus]MBB5287398.1 putative membrane protein [Rhabdobacter roseus]